MKKILAAMLSGVIAIAACGCGASETSGTSSTADWTSGTASATASAAESDNSSAEATSAATSATTTAATTSAPEEIDYSVLSEQEIYGMMIKRSLITTGDVTRMSNVLDRAAKGEEITAAYIGGSITEGYHDNLTLEEDQKWAKMSTNWLQEQYPDAKFNYVNAGISGTPSVLGNVRLERDVLAYNPDIVFVEFAVNDGTEEIYKTAYEGLVRTLLENEREIAVVLLFTIVENGHTCQPHMTEIGSNYNLPMISLPDSIWVEMQEGRMVWDDYSGDGSHPHVEGGKMILDMVKNYYTAVQSNLATGDVDRTLPAPVFSGDYTNMHFFDSEELNPELVGFEKADTHGSFHNGWQYRGETGASMKFDINCKKLAMVFKANKAKMYGTAQIYVDGEMVKEVASNMDDGWQNPVTVYLIDDTEAADHIVEIKVEGKAYYAVMAFGSNR